MKKTLMVAVLSAFLGSMVTLAYAEKQPHMVKAWELLEKAQKTLETAAHDKGGHRLKAIELIKAAMGEVKEGMETANEKK